MSWENRNKPKLFLLLLALSYICFDCNAQINVTFGPIQSINDSLSGLKNIQVADIENDGDEDLITIANGDVIYWLENNGLGEYPNIHQINDSTNSTSSISLIKTVDIDNDGMIDVLAGSSSSGNYKIVWFKNEGFGNFSNEHIIIDSIGGASDIEAVDMDMDGDLDVFYTIADAYSPPIWNFPPYNLIPPLDDQLFWIENMANNSLNFGTLHIIEIPAVESLEQIHNIEAADLDYDGDADIAYSSRGSSGWIENLGTNDEFQVHYLEEHPNYSWSYGGILRLSDMNNDDLLDIVYVGTSYYGSARNFLNNGEGLFMSNGICGNTYESKEIDVGDIDNDGYNEIISFSNGPSSIKRIAIVDNVNGQLQAPPLNIYGMEGFPKGVVILDNDNDGDMDIIGTSSDTINNFFWIENLSNPVFSIIERINSNCTALGKVIIEQNIGSLPYEYILYKDSVPLWSDTSTSSMDSIVYLLPGNYDLYLEDISGLLDTLSFEIFGPALDTLYNLDIEYEVSSPIRPDLNNLINLRYRNDDCLSTDGEAWIVIPSTYIYVDSFEVTPTEITGDTLKWSFSQLNKDSGWKTIDIYIKASPNVETIEEICFTSGVYPLANDIDTSSNFYQICQPVLPSLIVMIEDYQCSENGIIDFEFFSESLPHYYTWVNGDSSVIANDTSYTSAFSIQNLMSGSWNITISDNIGNSFNKSYYVQPPFGNDYVDFSGFMSSGAFIPGASDYLTINYFNIGCNPSGGELILVLDTNITITSAPGASIITTDSIVWPISAISANSPNSFITVHYTTNINLNLAEELCFQLILLPDSADYNVNNNIKHYCWTALAPYDPNDKAVYPRGICSENFVQKDVPLEYLIRYQNSGTAPAINVTVLDTFDYELLPNSLRLLSASYEPTFVEQINDSVVAFRMYNINLPDSGTNLQASQGYVYFTIEIDSLTNDNQTIENNAAIYFDYNEPIITNTTFNTVVSDLTSVHAINYDTLNYCDSAYINGVWYFNSQMFSDTFVKSNGCDSIINTTLSLSYSYFETQTQIACDSVEVFGNWYFSSQTINDTLSTAKSCDSIIQTNIIINHSVSQYDSIVSCDSAIVNGDWYFSTQIVSDTFQTINNCDSIINTDLTIYYSTFEIQAKTACDNIEVFGNWYYSSQTIYDTFLTENSCDSLIQTNITIYNSVTQNLMLSECNSAQINGNWYYNSHFIRDTFQTINSCDSIIYTDLTIFYSAYANLQIIGCDSIEILGDWLMSNTLLFDTLNNNNGCDSIIEYNITIDHSYAATIFDTVLIGETYTLPSGNIVNQTGTYFDTLQTAENCDSTFTINLFLIDDVGIITVQKYNIDWLVYPNPATNSFTIELNDYDKNYAIEIQNIVGQIIYTDIKQTPQSIIEAKNWSNGVYYISLKNEIGEFLGRKKIVINK